MSDELQALGFLAGANSIFYGEKLLTTGNPGRRARPRAVRAPGHQCRDAGAAPTRAACVLTAPVPCASSRTDAACAHRAAPSSGRRAGESTRRRCAARRRASARSGPAPTRAHRGRRPARCVNFCSNDYLGLAHASARWRRAHGRLRARCGRRRRRLAPGLRPRRGTRSLEAELADFTGRERALLFSTGYMANLGVLSALAGARRPGARRTG